ncbi:ribonuclease Y [Candidatus Fermentibacteria bacterium]|nr:MAG: ribonuclease Y [Candidatus Fermentibacteria bacterium]
MLGYLIPAAAAGVAFILGLLFHKMLVNKEIGGATTEAERILAEARRESETLRKETVLEGREVIAEERAKVQERLRKKQSELDRRENSINRQNQQLERTRENLEGKTETLSQQETALGEMEQALIAKHQRANKLLEEQNARLEEAAQLSREEAKELLLSNLREETDMEAAKLTRSILDEAERTAEDKAASLLATAIQRCAANHVVESCVSVVNLSNDDMKGRIIGREGRNIRAFEKATGVDVVIDDTPEAVVLSCFDPVRREVARLSLEKLISDGRIHPGRIESVVGKIRNEMERTIRKLGNELVMEASVTGLHPQLVRHLGRLRYRTSYGQNMYQHSLEVAHICGLLASELRLDPGLARRAGLLHDIGKATDHDLEGSHAMVGMELARKYNEPRSVANAIGAHHEEVEPESLYAILVQAADAVSSARPGARRETLELYVKRLHRLETMADSFEGVKKSYAIQAGRELRIAVKPEAVNDDTAVDMARQIAKKIENEMEYPGQIKVTVIRELRASETAR